MSSLIQLAYVSLESHALSEQDLVDLLRQARKFNAANGITGMLLYKDGMFLQVLEGDPLVVSRLYDSIRKDTRHKGITRLYAEWVSERQFGYWSMGFQNLTHWQAPSLPGVSPIFDVPFRSDYFTDHPSDAQKLLLSFRGIAKFQDA
jgi:hypothetical protein